MLSGAQIRAGRALLGLSAQELSELSGVGWATIQRYEATNGVPNAQKPKMDLIMKALKCAGIEFIGDPVTSPGVRLRRPGDTEQSSAADP